MKKTFKLETIELAEAAVKDAKNFGLSASLQKNEEGIYITYSTLASYPEEKDEKDGEDEEKMSLEEIYSMMKYMFNEYDYRLKYMSENYAYMSENMNKHMYNGHLPSISDAGAMKKALKVLGLEESFEVKVPQIYVQY